MSALRLSFLVSTFCFPTSLHAISVGTAEKDTSPEAELASFTVLDGFEVNLFASEKDGVVNPISIRWDERGRLWVLTTTSYPQPKPGEVCDDKILILEDTDHDGKADKTTVFADGLRMPMGLELAPNAIWPETPRSGDLQSPSKTPPRSGKNAASGNAADTEAASTAIANRRSLDARAANEGHAAYIGEGEKLWLMRDTDGDDRADVREVVFSGFGTGDTHQCINSFTWTPDGALMFSQGLHCYSNVTTAWGGRRLYGAGFWLYRPLSGKLTPYPTGFPANAWGTVFDDAGQPFSVAGAAGMFWTTPLLVPQYGTEQGGASGSGSLPPAPGSLPYRVHLIERQALPNNGQIVKQGMLKYCGVDIPRNAHWPVDMHGELVSGGFFENCIYRHKLQDDKANPSGYEALRQPDLLKSSSVSFRPVDVKFGPDGALYISDWFNPIIGHYQASFRHPDRDKTHGRIWRVVRKDKALAEMRDLGKASTRELLIAFGAAVGRKDMAQDRWTLYQAQRLLMDQPKDEVFRQLDGLLYSSAKITETARHEFVTALQVRAMFESPEEQLVATMLTIHPEPWCRAYATRVTGLWQDHLQDPLSLLAKPIADENPRVRLEAIAACAHNPEPYSIVVALKALDKPMDSFLDRALELAVHALAPQWEPALAADKLELDARSLAYLMEKKNSDALVAVVRSLLKRQPEWVNIVSRRTMLLALAKQGTSEDVALALSEGVRDATLLSQLADLVEAQGIKPPANAEAKVGEASSLATRGPAPDAQTASSPSTLGTITSEGDMLRGWKPRLLSSTARLIGLWKLTAHAPSLRALLEAPATSAETKRHALIALARLDVEHDFILTTSRDTQQPWLVRLGAVEALCEKDSVNAARSALALMPVAKTEGDMRALLAPFLAKGGRMKQLVKQMDAAPCSKESADLATRALIGIGRNEPELTAVLNKILGRTAPVQPYDAQWVSSLANEATVSGNPKRGDEIFHRVTLNCIACHSIGGKGGIIGPQLDAVGRGVPTELLVEAVMWPQRQIKEGYVATTVVMKDGRTLAGYKVAESATDLQLRDMATQQVTTLPKAAMQSRTDAGSLMPDGLTASLSREELRDLIAYLASLGR